ncbi:tRNA (guanosine(46)-N7)-methyltransferase TrmB [Curvivirga aplysinae]|uniref:tRNA (guanosine(46)-N7)-methyltransferase TrmB n=1 Tax=Curvivirga aplysinae TaxID=2529852 RepID=UPI0012BC7491|nr:tRNA (guanosine(46)-N7)-methyltransferase TrmB [Curvivirga aplysinae]MTI09544.1 tRNA (guanosine(46)-N7)-methyltransferase TrmB [Curvivirga aplysinae]
MTDKYDPTKNPLYSEQNPNEIKFFGRRHGRTLNDKKQQLVDEVLPTLGVDTSVDQIDLAQVFGEEKKEYWLEIGFGSGEHLAWQAQNNPHVGIIGCEPFINGVARLLVHLEDEKLANVRVHSDDARQIMDKLPDGCLSKIFVLFPDPWPKYKHRLRRFVGPHNIPKFERLLRDGGEFRLASDHKQYVRWAMMHLMASENLDWIDEGPKDWYNRRDDWPATRYEQKALAGNPHYLRFMRKTR